MQRLRAFSPTAVRSAALVVLFCTSALAADPDPTPEARAHFKAGVAYMDAQRYEDAYREFKAAYDATPTWKMLGNLGVAADHLERDGEAIDIFEDYMRRGGERIPPHETGEVRSDLARLRSGVATVTLEASSSSFWIVDTRLDAASKVVNRYGPFDGRTELRVRAGKHEFSVEGLTPLPSAWTVLLVPSDTAQHSFVAQPETPAAVPELEQVSTRVLPDAETAEPSHMPSYVLWGAGGLAAITSAVLFVESNRIQSEANRDYANRCPFGASEVMGCESTTADSRRAAHWRTASLVTGIAAVGALVTGTVLYFVSDSAENGSSEEASWQPWVSPAGVGVSGRF